MKQIFRCLVALGLMGAAVVDASAQDIGIVNMERVLQESESGKAVQGELEKRFGPEQEKFAEREREIRQLQASLERDKPLMSKAQVEKQEADIKTRIEAFEKDFNAIQKEVMEAQQEEGQKLIAPAREAVVEVAKKKKLGAVFEASRAGLLYLGENADITDQVIKALDAK
ncbi:MAG: OmpH family outer membrane protein [Thiohalocapsa sp.]